MSIIRKESTIKRKDGSTVYVQKNVQNNLTHVNQIGYDSNFVNSVNTNTDLVFETHRKVQQLSHESVVSKQENKKRHNDLEKRHYDLEKRHNDLEKKVNQMEIIQNELKNIIQRQIERNGSQMFVEQDNVESVRSYTSKEIACDNVESVRSYTSKEIACTTILNLLFKRKIKCLFFRSFFPLLKSMKLWDIDKKNELREYIKKDNVYNIRKQGKGNLEVIVTRDDSRLICDQYNVEDIVSLIKDIFCKSSSDIPLNNLYQLFKDMNMFKEEKCAFKQLLIKEKFRLETGKTEYVGI